MGVFHYTWYNDLTDVGDIFTMLNLLYDRHKAVLPSLYNIFSATSYPFHNPTNGTLRYDYVNYQPGDRVLSGGKMYDNSTSVYAVCRNSSNILYKRHIRCLFYIDETDGVKINSTCQSLLENALDNIYNSTDYELLTENGDHITFLEIEPKLHFRQNWRYPRKQPIHN